MSKERIIGIIEDLLINSIRILKDEDHQRRVWFLNEGPEIGSYIDTCVHLIDRCEKLFNDPTSEDFFGQKNYTQLRKLYKLVVEHVDLVEDRIDPDFLTEEELLNDPNWHDIQTLAEKTEEMLLELLTRRKHD